MYRWCLDSCRMPMDRWMWTGKSSNEQQGTSFALWVVLTNSSEALHRDTPRPQISVLCLQAIIHIACQYFCEPVQVDSALSPSKLTSRGKEAAATAVSIRLSPAWHSRRDFYFIFANSSSDLLSPYNLNRSTTASLEVRSLQETAKPDSMV